MQLTSSYDVKRTITYCTSTMQILITITLQLLRVLELAVLGLTAYFVVPYEEFTLAARRVWRKGGSILAKCDP